MKDAVTNAMTGGSSLLLALLMLVALLTQAIWPRQRLLIVTGAAGLSCAVGALAGVATVRGVLADVPWDVLVILVGLGLLSDLLAETRVFGVLAARAARRSAGAPRALILLFTVPMYVVSGLVNNLTALLLVMPVLLILLKLLAARQRFVTWTLGVLIVACNLGGAATPIGDFPAILLMGRGSMVFGDYLAAAAPPTAAALAVLLIVVLAFVRPDRDLPRAPVLVRVSLGTMTALYRSVRVDRRLLVPVLLLLLGMLVAWVAVPPSTGFGPELICWLGAGLALALRPRTGERLLRTRVDIEAVLFLLSLFVMVGAVRRSGLFEQAARALTALPWPPEAQLALFLLTAGVLTGVFSAGPSMAALLDVAEALARTLPPTAVYVGLALSVCAGSSLFLTAATSGPMAQMLTERAKLRDDQGAPVTFGFFAFLPVGLVAFAIIQVTALVFAFAALAWR